MLYTIQVPESKGSNLGLSAVEKQVNMALQANKGSSERKDPTDWHLEEITLLFPHGSASTIVSLTVRLRRVISLVLSSEEAMTDKWMSGTRTWCEDCQRFFYDNAVV